MGDKLTRLAKCAALECARLRRTWLFDVRTVLGLTQPEMAQLLGLSRRAYQERERDPSMLRIDEYLRAGALLQECGVDSRGKMRAAKAVSA